MSFADHVVNHFLIRAVILGGCGTLMTSHLGFLQALKHHNMLRYIKHYVGISAGSIIAFLFTLGLSIDIIYKDIIAYDVMQFLRQSNPLYKLINECGILDLSIMGQKIKDLLLSNQQNPNMTFQEHYNATGKTLTVVATDAFTMTPIYANHYTSPNIPVLDMILGSCCIPFAFGTRRHPESGQHMIDGIFSDAEPFQYLHAEHQFRSFEICAHLLELSNLIPTNRPISLLNNIVVSLFEKTKSSIANKDAIIIVRTPLYEFSALDIRFQEEHHYSFYKEALLCTLQTIENACRKPYLNNNTVEEGFAHDR